jgi:hypothetical protein
MPSTINTIKHKKWPQLFQHQSVQYNICTIDREMCHHHLQGRNYVYVRHVPLTLRSLPANIHGVTFQKKPLYPKAFTAPDSVNFLGQICREDEWQVHNILRAISVIIRETEYLGCQSMSHAYLPKPLTHSWLRTTEVLLVESSAHSSSSWFLKMFHEAELYFAQTLGCEYSFKDISNGWSTG